jgi:ATP-dependent RNA helicase DHX40
MEGRGTVAFVHPSSALFQSDEKVNWVVFHEIVWTNKPFMRMLCPIAYSFVEHLLPKLHQVNVMLRATGAASAMRLAHTDDGPPPAKAPRPEDAARRTTDIEVDEARQRYLDRKRRRAGKQFAAAP